MVKLVYTLASGASPRKWVQVQVLFRAQSGYGKIPDFSLYYNLTSDYIKS